MKSLRMVLVKMEDFVASSPPDDGSFFSSVTPLRVVSLAANKSSDNSNGNYHGRYNLNFRFNPSLGVVVIGLLVFFFLAAVFSILTCRRTTPLPRGLERTAIENFPVFNYNFVKGLKPQAKGSECAVCLSEFEEEEMVRLLPKCSHAFHPECIDKWLCLHTTCPVCRTSLLPEEGSNPTSTDSGIVEPQMPPQQVAIVMDDGGNRTDIGNDEANNGAPGTSHGSTGRSMVRLQQELAQTTEWTYIATPGGLTPELRRTCSFVGAHQSQPPSISNSEPARIMPGDYMDDAAERSRSERWGSIP